LFSTRHEGKVVAMFTGIVEETAAVVEATPQPGGGVRVAIESALDHADTKLGDSIALDGVCLTVVGLSAVERVGTARLSRLAFDLGPETLQVTSLGRLAVGSRVHVERALRLSDRLGGHLVAGHVDAVGTVERAEKSGDALFLRVAAPPSVLRYCIHKGSITVLGVSLTLNAVDARGFEVCLIPHTLAKTKLGALAVGEPVHLESDLVGKYVERLLPPPVQPPVR
jgi:riboflavin synthase